MTEWNPSQWKTNLKMFRERKNWSQKELADKLGLKQSTIAAYETGVNEPKLELFVKMANCFDISVDHLIGNSRENDENLAIYEQLIQLNPRDRFILKKVLDAFDDHDEMK